MRRPSIHEPAPLLEQVTTPVRCLDPVADHMRQRRLGDLTGEVGALSGPVPERRPEPMRRQITRQPRSLPSWRRGAL
jgi:hypothetical protein